MAVAKRAAPPRSSGGSARNAIYYVLAEELSEKVVHLQKDDPLHPSQHAGLSALMAESLQREDYGVGEVWSPTQTADSRRPSSIFARGVSSLYTADMEIGQLGAAQRRTRSPVLHFIVSLNTEESQRVSDKTLIEFTAATLDGAGLKGHSGVFAVHRDTLLNPDGSQQRDKNGKAVGNLHCHAIVSSIHSEHLRSYDRKQDNLRLSTSLREQEIVFGLQKDWGLAIRRDVGLPTERVERTNLQDWETRHRELVEQRIERLAYSFLEDNPLDSVRDRQDRLVYSMREYLSRCNDRGERPLQSDLHAIAGRIGGRIESVKDDSIRVRIMQRAEDGVRSSWTDSFGDTYHQQAKWAPTDTVVDLDVKRIARSPLDKHNGKHKPNEYLLGIHENALKQRGFLLGVRSAAEAEAEYREVIKADPGRVTRDIVYGDGKANFTADDIDALLAVHITDGWSDETDRTLREDTSIRVLSLDSASPLYTTAPQQDLTHKFDRLLRQLLKEKDPGFNREALDTAITRVEQRFQKDNPGFKFTKQQRKAFDSFELRLAVHMGEAGTGKSSLNAVHKEYTDILGREIRGFCTSQKAADVLKETSGIQSVNQARALFHESQGGKRVMPMDARFVYDEFSMSSIESGVAILERAIESNASGILQLDLSQLPNIQAGNTGGIATRAAQDAKTLVRINEVFRQKQGSTVEWMRLAVPKGGRAIRTANAVAFRAYLEDYIDRGHVTFHATREEEIRAIADDILEAMRAGQKVIAPGRSFADCLYVNREVRAGLGLEGKGREFEFERGVIEISPGDRVMFKKNSLRLGVNNSDTATVTNLQKDEKGRWQITADLDSGTTVVFNPAWYKHVTWSYASTVHSQQGSCSPVVIGSITKGDDARSVHVTATRTESVLHMHTHLTRDQVLAGLSSDKSLSAKEDAMLYASIVAKTGGANTPWARAVKKAQQHAEDPLRQRHVAVMADRAQKMKAAVLTILGHTGLGPRERDRQLREAVERYAPDSFVSWAAKEKKTIERELDFSQKRQQSQAPQQAPKQKRRI